MSSAKPTEVQVYLVGAGPGDPQMITLRAVECLQRADVVLYDYLVNPRVLQHARDAAELTCLGKHGEGKIWSQDEINQRLVELAQAGKTVVRLKGGDPAVFARGAEEAEALAKNRIRFEIVPGITAAFAAGSCAGIPITHRDLASAVALITGQEGPGKSTSSLDYEALARFPGTLIFYMGVTTAETWTAKLIEAGKPAETPAAILRRCSFPDQQKIICTLGDVAQRLAAPPKIRPPAIVIIGEVAALSETSSWFDKRPLFGQRVVVTRAAEQAASLVAKLEELGAEVHVQPAIEISDPPDWTPVDDALGRLGEFDWLVFSSTNGVHCFFKRLFATDRDLRALGHIQLAAVGSRTADALRDYRLNVDFHPAEYRAEALAAGLAEEAVGKRFLLVRASRGREVLAEQLRAAGGSVEQIVVYCSTDVPAASPGVAHLVADQQINWITVTSSAIARSLVQMFGDDLKKARLASISPVTSATLNELGHSPTIEATEYTMDGVVRAIADYR